MNHQPFVLVTGGAYRVGRAITLDFAARGYTVGIHYHHSEAKALALRDEITQQGGTAKLFPADLTNEESIQKLVESVVNQKLNLKVLINSAAIMPKQNITETSTALWDEVINLNLRAVWMLSKQFQPLLKENHGVIINFADSGVNKVWSGYPIYILSKTALVKLSQLLAKDFAPNIRVVTISPGLLLKADDMPQNTWNGLVNKTPMKQEISMLDLLETIQFCVNNQSLTGEVITLDGGYQLV